MSNNSNNNKRKSSFLEDNDDNNQLQIVPLVKRNKKDIKTEAQEKIEQLVKDIIELNKEGGELGTFKDEDIGLEFNRESRYIFDQVTKQIEKLRKQHVKEKLNKKFVRGVDDNYEDKEKLVWQLFKFIRLNYPIHEFTVQGPKNLQEPWKNNETTYVVAALPQTSSRTPTKLHTVYLNPSTGNYHVWTGKHWRHVISPIQIGDNDEDTNHNGQKLLTGSEAEEEAEEEEAETETGTELAVVTGDTPTPGTETGVEGNGDISKDLKTSIPKGFSNNLYFEKYNEDEAIGNGEEDEFIRITERALSLEYLYSFLDSADENNDDPYNDPHVDISKTYESFEFMKDEVYGRNFGPFPKLKSTSKAIIKKGKNSDGDVDNGEEEEDEDEDDDNNNNNGGYPFGSGESTLRGWARFPIVKNKFTGARYVHNGDTWHKLILENVDENGGEALTEKMTFPKREYYQINNQIKHLMKGELSKDRFFWSDDASSFIKFKLEKFERKF